MLVLESDWKGNVHCGVFFQVEAFDDITSEQLICVSTGKSYIRPQSQNNIVEIRANWGRARKQHGPQATDLCVTVSKNPNVDVSGMLCQSLFLFSLFCLALFYGLM